jgi:anti-anti-sigma factor
MAQSTFVTTQTSGRAGVARLERQKLGELEVQAVLTELGACVAAHGGRIAIDLTQVLLIASAGLGALLTVNKQCKAAGGRMALFGLGEELMGMLKLTNLHKVLLIEPTRDAAVKAVS